MDFSHHALQRSIFENFYEELSSNPSLQQEGIAREKAGDENLELLTFDEHAALADYLTRNFCEQANDVQMGTCAIEIALATSGGPLSGTKRPRSHVIGDIARVIQEMRKRQLNPALTEQMTEMYKILIALPRCTCEN